MAFSYSILGLLETITRVQKLEGEIIAAMNKGTVAGMREGVRIIQGSAKANRQTGDHINSIQQSLDSPGVVAVGRMFTDSPYGARLEFGFSGQTDVLGRFYENWGPFPHFEPSLPECEVVLLDSVIGAIEKVI